MKATIIFMFNLFLCLNAISQAIVADHTKAKLNLIPDSAIVQAKANLHIAYGHTSHGSQIIDGMSGLETWKGQPFYWNDGVAADQLDIDDYFVSGDLGHLGDTAWAASTREYLNNPGNSNVNIVIWSWCGGVSDNTVNGINTYLNKMNDLETSYPGVKFIYMTGHLDGSGTSGNLHQRNEQIRNFCINNNKILFDFADIESYDPDGNYYLDKAANDNCDYDSDGNNSLDKNWAIDWQNAHTLNTDWYECSAAHSQDLNGNLKAYAAWWLWSRLAGWNGTTSVEKIHSVPKPEIQSKIFPNPSSDKAKLIIELPQESSTLVKIINSKGEAFMEISLGKLRKGSHEFEFDISNLKNGLYFYQINTSYHRITKKLIVK